jgi:DNA-binding transcriptional LysR family regulator
LLVELLPGWLSEVYPLYVLYPSNHLPAAKVRAFIDFVVDVIKGSKEFPSMM